MPDISISTASATPETKGKTYPEICIAVHRLGNGYMTREISTADMEQPMRKTWRHFLELAKESTYPHCFGKRDLILMILQFKQLGTITRLKEGGGSSEDREEEAIFPNGQHLWTDLPYLVEGIHTYWADEVCKLRPPELEWLSNWTSRLPSVGICLA
ncbi:uncharacterized protein LDX57_005373 [Aspergillus melleus]|uniref:uncharacterized protein n=1 Tax=Aspergillus melleus TaxID=138277 RepID=UPI001E8DA062|nr:uncharacterized protein LDX57_005373 [Aspergillus melleus]KAH8427662.1 hypothetical protein LDX57_005373 [Aspergillus melleus]